MRAAETINTVVFLFFIALAWHRSLPRRRRTVVTAMGAGALAVTFLTAFLAPVLLSPLAASVVRDWVPAALLLVVYWQAGQFFVRIDEKPQARLKALDDRLVTPALEWAARVPGGNWLMTYLECAYLFCYPMVPFALATLYLIGRRAYADWFWTVVLVSAYGCYVMVPFIQTLPPRSLAEREGVVLRPARVRAFNLWILSNASIHANTFPSAHVAASLACALVLLRLEWWAGLIFLVVAVSIALGAVAGRYHYLADAITGAMLALAIFGSTLLVPVGMR
jgi:membrane-associated phospholipid phosphatase